MPLAPGAIHRELLSWGKQEERVLLLELNQTVSKVHVGKVVWKGKNAEDRKIGIMCRLGRTKGKVSLHNKCK